MKFFFFYLLIFVVVFTSCSNQHTDSNSVAQEIYVDSSTGNDPETGYRYDLKNPIRTWELPAELKEVSGNTWVGENELLLINDNFAALSLFSIRDKKLVLDKTVPFQNGEKGKSDIEGVTIVQDVVYTLRSDGRLFKIDNWNSTPAITTIPTFLSKENNTEGLCYDPVTNHLLIACKEASGIEGENEFTRAVYQFDLSTEKLKDTPFLTIRKTDFEKLAGKEINFYPSDIAVHPVTKNIYLLSTQENKCMVIYNRAGELLSFQWIDKKLMPQPEGICFSPEGMLYISSEGKSGSGKLLEFESK